MLNILGPQSRFCDGLSRRSFLSIGSLAMGGRGLREVLAAEAVQGNSRPNKATIMILLPGGPPHQDMVDLKPQAPSEIRGEFHPIRTNVPGIEICELLPRLAQNMDKIAVLRSIVGGVNDHTAFRVDWMPFAGLKHSGYNVGGIHHTMHDMQVEKMLVLRSAEL